MQKSNKLIAFTAVITIVLLLALALSLTNSGKKQDRQIIFLHDSLPQKIIGSFEKTYLNKDILLRGEWHLATFLNNDHVEATLAYDIQAKPILDSGAEYYWTPLGKTTVVIAVDRDQTDHAISSWQDLESSELVLGMTRKLPEAGLILASLSRGMTGDELHTAWPVKLLRQKWRQNTLRFNDEKVPVQILFDYHALALMEQGYNLDIVIPEEGGLIFELGLLSKLPFESLPGGAEGNAHSGFENELLQVRACFQNSSLLPNLEEDLKNLGYTPPTNPDALSTALLSTMVHLDKEITGTHRYTTVTGMGYTLPALACIIGFVFWTIYTRQRIMQKSASNAITLIGISMVLWMSVRLIKWQFLIDSIENRYLWYSFYPFMMLMTASFLWLSISLGNLEDKGRPPRWWWYLIGVQSLLLLLVYTNDLHQQVFCFDLNSLYWSTIYSYGSGFLLVYAGYMLPLLTGIIILCVKCWKSPRRVRIFVPLFVVALLLLYVVGYIFKIPIAHNSDVTMLTCLFVMVFSETALRTGLIPQNTKYRHLFHRSSLEMQLLEQNGHTAFSAGVAKELPEDIKDRLLSMEMPAVLESGHNTLWFADSIVGGAAVWREDISQIMGLKNEISKMLIRLKETNRLLEYEKETKDKVASARASEDVYAIMDREASSWLKEIQRLAAEWAIVDQKQGLQEIRLLVTYIKRRCYFLFYAEKLKISSDAVTDAVAELLEIGEAMGIKNIRSVSLTGEIPTSGCLVLYDFVFYVLRYLSNEKDLIFTCFREKNSIRCTFIASTELTEFILPEKLMQTLDSVGGIVGYKCLEGAQSLTMEVPCDPEEEGGSNA